MDIFWVLLVSIPVFYIWGLISFFRMFKRGKNNITVPNRREYLATAIVDLKKEMAKNPEKKLLDLLTSYEEELKKLPQETVVQAIEPTQELSLPATGEVFKEVPKPQQHEGASVQNWYKDNSINLLLYIGAFLIVVSATIYVSLPNTTGPSKGLVFSTLTLVFLLSGLWFHTMPRIKNAGTAFTAIGALLIPVSGLGWYNFVFKYTNVSFGIVWLATSFIGLFVYILLARYFKSVFYSYISGFSTLSFVLAFFNMQGVQNDFYILGAILSSIVLLSLSLYLKNRQDQDSTLFLQPFAITANITMPVAIAYALFLTSQTTHFTLESTASVLLGCFFYLLSYRYFKKSEYLFAAQILFTLGLIYLGFWLHMNTLNVMYLLMGSLCANLSLVAYFKKRTQVQDTNVAVIFSILKPTVIYIFAQFDGIAPIHLLIFALIAMLVGIILAYLRKNPWYVGLSSVFLAVALYVLLIEQLHYGHQLYILGIIYTTLATCWYISAFHFKKSQHAIAICAFASVLYFTLSTIIIADSWRYQLLNGLTMTIVTFAASFQFAKKELIYLANTLLAFAVYTLLQLTHTRIEFYPLVYIVLSFVFYLISVMLTKEPKDEFRNSGLLGAVVMPGIFGWYSYSFFSYDYYDFSTNHTLELYSLIAFYATFVLYGFDAFSRKSRKMGYIASAIGLLAYLWQINFLGEKEMLYYTFMIGAYFFTLAFIERKRHNTSLKQLFDVVATFFLIIPTWSETFGSNGAVYALILGMIGICYLVYSITYQDKLYRYSGILAIVLAVVSQSKWAIIGLAGLFFLGFALYLLVYRKEESAHNKD